MRFQSNVMIQVCTHDYRYKRYETFNFFFLTFIIDYQLKIFIKTEINLIYNNLSL